MVFRQELAREDRAYVVAAAGGRHAPIAGYGGITVAAGEAHVLTLAVDPDRRREGTGRRLLLELLAQARERMASAATLEVRESNDAAYALYSGFGFVSAGIRPGYYADDREGARILWLHELRSEAVGAHLRRLAVDHGLELPRGLRPGSDEIDPADASEES